MSTDFLPVSILPLHWHPKQSFLVILIGFLFFIFKGIFLKVFKAGFLGFFFQKTLQTRYLKINARELWKHSCEHCHFEPSCLLLISVMSWTRPIYVAQLSNTSGANLFFLFLFFSSCLFAEHILDSSPNYSLFLHWTFSSPNMVRQVQQTILHS